MNYRRPLALAAALAAAVILAGCGNTGTDNTSAATSSPAPSASNTQQVPSGVPSPGMQAANGSMTIQVTGSCNDFKGFRLKSAGFTPNGKYHTAVIDPAGNPYGYIIDGSADKDGRTPNWTWDCKDGRNQQPDPEGIYVLTMMDEATGRSVTASFEVKY